MGLYCTQSEMRYWIDNTRPFGHQYCAAVAVRFGLIDFSDGYNSVDPGRMETLG